MIKYKILLFFHIFQQKIYFYKHPLLAQVGSSVWTPRGWQRGQPYGVQVGDLCHDLLHTGGIGSSGEVHGDGCTSISPAVWIYPSKVWGTAAPTALSCDPGMRHKDHANRALLSGANPAFAAWPMESGRWEDPPQVLHVGARCRMRGRRVPGWGWGWVCVCLSFLSQKSAFSVQ